MSLTPCAHDGHQRPVDVTCAERCERFPECVPSASPKLKGTIDAMVQAGAAEREAIISMLDRLNALLPDHPDRGSDCASTDRR
jgi:hypothetical protein